MKLTHFLMALAAGCMIAPAAMAKTGGGLRIKHVQAKGRVAGKSKTAKKPRQKKAAKPAPAESTPEI